MCYNISRFNSEISFLERYVVQNSFPCALVKSVIGNVSNFLMSPNNVVVTAENKPLFCAIPFITFRTNSLIKNSLREIIKANYTHLILKLVFVSSFKVRSFFEFKDCAPTSLVSNTVYLFI